MNFHLKDGLGVEFIKAKWYERGALTSFYIIWLHNTQAYRRFVG